jgi:putative ABC transport system ATP-binding protein
VPESLISCRELGKTYRTSGGAIEALRSVDAEIAPDAVTALVGASGSGKSTLLRAIAGLDRPTGGTLLVAGRDLTASSAGELRRHRRDVVTYVAQRPADNFVPHLTLAEHAHDARGRARELLVEVGLEHRLGSRPIELSGGEQARAAFALALARATPLIVVDEPTAELDRASAEPVLEVMHRHAGDGVAFVIATHDPDVTAIADTVLRIDRGRIVEGGAVSPPAAATAPPARGSDPVLELAGASKSYRRGTETVHALHEVSLDLRRGELAVVLGRSGSGKSTLLMLLAGWQSPDTGEIHRAGADPLAWAELGYLPQRFGLSPELSVRENVGLPARLAGRQDELAPRLEELLERFGLTDLADRRPAETSIGQQQRTALARALLLEPAVLLADEPTSHQDAGWRDSVWKLLAEASERGTACLVATHEEQAAAMATRCWTIAEGALG